MQDSAYFLIEAYKDFLEETDQTEKTFREIGNGLKGAIDTILDAATLMWSPKHQKLLCEIASFGKKRLDSESSEIGAKVKVNTHYSDLYVRTIKLLSFVNKLRYSAFCR